jgi:hypothetical protein
MECQAGTPHISELLADDGVSVQLNVEELGVVGEVAALDIAREPTAVTFQIAMMGSTSR